MTAAGCEAVFRKYTSLDPENWANQGMHKNSELRDFWPAISHSTYMPQLISAEF